MVLGNTKLARVLLYMCAVGDVVSFVLVCGASSYAAAWWALLGLVALGNVAVLSYAQQQGYFVERQIVKAFKKTCAGVGLTGQSNKIGFFGIGVGRMIDFTGKLAEAEAVVYPKLCRITGTAEQWVAEIKFLYGQKVSDYTAHADSFALSFQAPFCGFDIADSGLIRMRVGQVSVPAAYNFEDEAESGGGAWDLSAN